MAIVKKIKLEEFNQTIEKICTLSDNRFSRIITSGYIDTVTENDVDKTYMVFVYNDNTDTREHKLKVDITSLNVIDDTSNGLDKTLSANKIYSLIEEATGTDLSEYLKWEDVYIVGLRYVQCDDTTDGAILVTSSNKDLIQSDAKEGVTFEVGDYAVKKKVKLDTLFFKRDEVLADPNETDEDTRMRLINDMIEELNNKYPIGVSRPID